MPWGELLILLSSAAILSLLLIPQINIVQAETGKTSVGSRGESVSVYSAGTPVRIRASLDHRPVQDTVYRIEMSGCLDSLRVGNEQVPTSLCPNNLKTRDLDLGPYLHDGTNEVEAFVRTVKKNQKVQFDIFPSPSKNNVFLLATSVLWLIVLVAWSAAIMRRWITRDWAVSLIFVAGVIIRWKYLTMTPYNVRSYDSSGHLAYISFLAKQWTLPPGGGGWEFHQAPLYYAIASMLLRICRVLGWQGGLSSIILQHLSLALSIAVQMAGTWVCVLLLKKNRLATALAAGGVAALPALVMTSARLTNDVLVTFWIAVGSIVLLRWWETKSMRSWLVFWIIAALAFLTKMNGIVLAIAAIATLAFAHEIPWKRKLLLCLVGLLLSGIIAGWLPTMRLTANTRDVKNFVMTGKVGLNKKLCATRSAKDFLVFNPVAVINRPFVSTWSDTSRRQNYWEFFFRSAFFGEFTFNHTLWARMIIAFAIVCLPLLFFGMRRSLGNRYDLPIHILAGTILVTSIAYAIIFRCYPEQDFRFSLFLGIIGPAFLGLGIQRLPRTLQIVSTAVAATLWILCATLLVAS